MAERAVKAGCPRLQGVEAIGGPLSMGCRREDGALVVSEDRQPAGEVRRVVVAHLGGDAEIGAEERRAELRHQFLRRIPFIAPALAPELPVEARRMASRVRE